MCQEEKKLDVLNAELAKLGNDKPTAQEAIQLEKQLRAFDENFDISTIDWSKTGKEIRAQLEPMITNFLEIARIKAAEKAQAAVEELDTKVSSETIPTLWPSFAPGIKIIIVLMLIMLTLFCSANIWIQYKAPEPDFTELMLTFGMYAVTLIAFVTWPIKSLAAKSLEIATIVASAKVNKANNKTASKKGTP